MARPIAVSSITDFDITSLQCPLNPERACPARARLSQPHEGNDAGLPPTTALSPELERQRSRGNVLLCGGLAEHAVQAWVRGCKEPTETLCPPWVEMTSSPVRKSIVGVAKSILKLTNRGTNG